MKNILDIHQPILEYLLPNTNYDTIKNLKLKSLDISFFKELSESVIYQQFVNELNSLGFKTTIEKIKSYQKLTLFSIKVPKCIGGIRHLTHLIISTVDEIPDEITELTNLETLEIYNTTAKLPKKIGNLTKLKSLKLIMCSQLKTFPISIKNLKQLQTLTINNCPELKFDLSKLGELSALEELEIIGGYYKHYKSVVDTEFYFRLREVNVIRNYFGEFA